MRCQTCTHACLLEGTAEISIVFTRLRQCAPHLTHGLSGPQECVPKWHLDQFRCFWTPTWQPTTILDSSDAHWDHSRRLLGSFYFVQKLVGIQAAVQLLTKGFSIWLENAYSCLQNRVYGGLTPKSAALSMTPQKAHPSGETRHTMYRSLRSVHLFLHSTPFYTTPQSPML